MDRPRISRITGGNSHHRWVVIIVYRRESDLIKVDHYFKKSKPPGLVEVGPDCNIIEKINVRLNPHRIDYPNATAEASQKS